ncbi:MAG: hypothetical protein KF847_18385 [Pirellulales bacterium]|nr:hypothetical protein [Pirellulales bacterium]
MFTSVVNVPPTVAAQYAGNGTQLNLFSGGALQQGFEALLGSEINVYGGSIGSSFNAEPGSVVNLHGGTIGTSFRAKLGSDVEFFGGEFVLNGVPYVGNSITLSGNDVFTGTLADGSPFILSPQGGDILQTVALTPFALPPLVTIPETLNGPLGTRPAGLRIGQSLTVGPGGSLGVDFAVVDAALTMSGGSVGKLRVARGTVSVSQAAVGPILIYAGGEATIGPGGHATNDLRVFDGGVLNINGGTIGDFASSFPGAKVNLTAGSVGNTFRPIDSEVNIQGGSIGSFFEPTRGTINLSGGTIGGAFRSYGSQVNISGGALLDGGVAYAGSVVRQSGGAVGKRYDVQEGATMSIDGGTIGRGFLVRARSHTELIGGEFSPALSEMRSTLGGQCHEAFGQLDDFSRERPDRGNAR